jgi:hypothetical protein
VVFELLQVAQRGQRALPAEAVQPPEHHQIKLVLIGLQQQLLKGRATSLAARLLVRVHVVDATVLLGKGPQLVQLVLRILAFVLRRDTGINSDSHPQIYPPKKGVKKHLEKSAFPAR